MVFLMVLLTILGALIVDRSRLKRCEKEELSKTLKDKDLINVDFQF
jgi:hypothetical protein